MNDESPEKPMIVVPEHDRDLIGGSALLDARSDICLRMLSMPLQRRLHAHQFGRWRGAMFERQPGTGQFDDHYWIYISTRNYGEIPDGLDTHPWWLSVDVDPGDPTYCTYNFAVPTKYSPMVEAFELAIRIGWAAN